MLLGGRMPSRFLWMHPVSVKDLEAKLIVLPEDVQATIEKAS